MDLAPVHLLLEISRNLHFKRRMTTLRIDARETTYSKENELSLNYNK